ncbi:MAG: ATP-binding cassette domain-containing protein [Solobacterium sp.]|nr:ATP-binding cassette domain-containing protein [Solobacterium sp.]
MGWFEEQIKQRQINDDMEFQNTFARIASAVTGDSSYLSILNDSEAGRTAIEEILNWFGIKPKTLPSEINEINEQIEFLTRPAGIMRRSVALTPGWWKDATGPMLGFLKETGKPAALLPDVAGRYYYHNPANGQKIRLNSHTEANIERNAYCFYKPFPLREMGIQDLLIYAWQCRSPFDTVMLLVTTAVGTGIGLLSTRANYLLMGKILHSQEIHALIGIAAFIIGISVCQTINSIYSSLVSQRLEGRQSIQVRAAVMMRILSLPPNFFRQYSSGELSQRSSYIQTLTTMLFSSAFITGLNSIFSLAYIGQIIQYAPSLLIPAFIVILSTIVINAITAAMQMQVSRERMQLSAKESGMSYSMISGIQKIRLSGAEKRFFSRWGNLYAKVLNYSYNMPLFLKLSSVISSAIGLAGTFMIYRAAIFSSITYEEYFAFNYAYGMVFSALMSIASIVTQLAGIKPIIEMVDPILKTVPENSEGKEYLTSLSGSIEVANVSFRYEPNQPYVLHNMSFRINPGQYIAIVGKSGCGKSTLVRLLLGFEAPANGTIFYDGKDLQMIEAKSLRQKIGTVTQDGKLFTGSIYENIIISAPWLTMDDAWEAAEIAGLADEIRKLPMGMHTMISEGSGGFSGGQKQRMMIARAIAPKPKILIFDEATSALDNITQKRVSDALDKLKCTRIVIAHRLSTIQHCDRILVIDGGSIIEDGTYEELLAQNGFFADLVHRQIVDERRMTEEEDRQETPQDAQILSDAPSLLPEETPA